MEQLCAWAGLSRRRHVRMRVTRPCRKRGTHVDKRDAPLPMLALNVVLHHVTHAAPVVRFDGFLHVPASADVPFVCSVEAIQRLVQCLCAPDHAPLCEQLALAVVKRVVQRVEPPVVAAACCVDLLFATCPNIAVRALLSLVHKSPPRRELCVLLEAAFAAGVPLSAALLAECVRFYAACGGRSCHAASPVVRAALAYWLQDEGALRDVFTKYGHVLTLPVARACLRRDLSRAVACRLPEEWWVVDDGFHPLVPLFWEVARGEHGDRAVRVVMRNRRRVDVCRAVAVLATHVPDDKRADKCFVCFEPYRTACRSKLLPCGHWAHHECLLQWVLEDGTCGVCGDYFADMDPWDSVRALVET